MTTKGTAMSSTNIKYPITWAQAERISALITELRPDLGIVGVQFSTLPLNNELIFTIHTAIAQDHDYEVILRARVIAAFTVESNEPDGMDAWTWDHLVRTVSVRQGKDNAWHARICGSAALSPTLWAKWEELTKEATSV